MSTVQLEAPGETLRGCVLLSGAGLAGPIGAVPGRLAAGAGGTPAVIGVVGAVGVVGFVAAKGAATPEAVDGESMTLTVPPPGAAVGPGIVGAAGVVGATVVAGGSDTIADAGGAGVVVVIVVVSRSLRLHAVNAACRPTRKGP